MAYSKRLVGVLYGNRPIASGGSPLDVFALHFFEWLGLAFYGFGHAVCHGTAGRADACHNGVLFFHPLHFLANNLILVFYTDLTLMFVACP
jgi:hypothetical protein